MTQLDDQTRELALKRLSAMTDADITRLANEQQHQNAYEEAERRKAEQIRADRDGINARERAYLAAEKRVVDGWVEFCEALAAMVQAHRHAAFDETGGKRHGPIPDAWAREGTVAGQMLKATPHQEVVRPLLLKMLGIGHLNFG